MNISIECVIKPSTLLNCTKRSNPRLEEFTCAIIFTLQISSKIIRWCILAQTNSAWLVDVVIWVAITSDSLNSPLFTVFLRHRGRPSITTAVHPKISNNSSQQSLDWPISLSWHAVGLARFLQTLTLRGMSVGRVQVRLPARTDWFVSLTRAGVTFDQHCKCMLSRSSFRAFLDLQKSFWISMQYTFASIAQCMCTPKNIFSKKKQLMLLLLSSMRIELSSLEYSVSHSTQAAPYTHARRIRLLFAKRQRGIFKLHVGCANTQWTSGIFSPVLQGPG